MSLLLLFGGAAGPITGSAAITLAALTSSAAGTVAVAGQAAITLDAAQTKHATQPTVSVLTSGTGNGGANDSTASISPTANRLILAAVSLYDTGDSTPETVSITGCGLTWVDITPAGITFGGPTYTDQRLMLFRAMGSAPTSGALTLTYSDSTPDAAAWIVAEVSAVDTSGTNGSGAVVQVASASSGASSVDTLQVTLAPSASEQNLSLAFFSSYAFVAMTEKSGWTEVVETGSAPSGSLELQSRATDPADPYPIGNPAGSAYQGGVALEVAAAPAAGTVAVSGAASITLGDLTLVSEGLLSSPLVGVANITLASVTAGASGTVQVRGAAAITLSLTLVATARVPDYAALSVVALPGTGVPRKLAVVVDQAPATVHMRSTPGQVRVQATPGLVLSVEEA